MRYRNTIKMIGLDLDGTSLDEYGDFTLRLRKALKEAKNRGIHIVIATGRSFFSLPSVLDEMHEIEYVITSNGARIITLNDGKTIYENCLSKESVRKVHEVIIKYGANLEIFTKGKAYIGVSEYRDILSGRILTRDAQYVFNTRTAIEDIHDFMLQNEEEIENISINYHDDDAKNEVESALRRIDDITVTSSFELNTEIGSRTTSKATALEFLLNKFNISKSELMVCGDGENDSAMIKSAGLGVAMGNAPECVKAVADFVTSCNHEEGVAQAIEKFIL